MRPANSPKPRSSDKIRFFNPHAIKVETELGVIRTLLTSFYLPAAIQSSLDQSYEALISSIPKYNFTRRSSNPPDYDFDVFWLEWHQFRITVLEHASRPAIELSELFMIETLLSFENILNSVKSATPTKIPGYREYIQSRNNLLTGFSDLVHLIMEQYALEAAVEHRVHCLWTCKTQIRRFRTELTNKYGSVFEKSLQESEIKRAQKAQCIRLLDDVLSEITDLPRQCKVPQTLREEIRRVETLLLADWKPRRVIVIPFEPRKSGVAIQPTSHRMKTSRRSK
jgi:hypothetical protein